MSCGRSGCCVAVERAGTWCGTCRGGLDESLPQRARDALSQENEGALIVRRLVLVRRALGLVGVAAAVTDRHTVVFPKQGASHCDCHGQWAPMPYGPLWLNLVGWWCVVAHSIHRTMAHHRADEPVFRLSGIPWGPRQ